MRSDFPRPPRVVSVITSSEKVAREIEQVCTAHVSGKAVYAFRRHAHDDVVALPGSVTEAMDAAGSLDDKTLLMRATSTTREVFAVIYAAETEADRAQISQIPSSLEVVDDHVSYHAFIVDGPTAEINVVRDLINSGDDLYCSLDFLPVPIGRTELTDSSAKRLFSGEPLTIYTPTDLFCRLRPFAGLRIQDKAADILLSAIPGQPILCDQRGSFRHLFEPAECAKADLSNQAKPLCLWFGEYGSHPARGLVVRVENGASGPCCHGDHPSFTITSPWHTYYVHLLQGNEDDAAYINLLQQAHTRGPVSIQDFVPLPSEEFLIAPAALKRMRRHGLRQSACAARFLTLLLKTC